MKYLLFFLLFPFFLQAQFNVQKEKYWIYRERLKNFMVSDNCQGCSVPANSREGWNYNNNTGNRLNMNDSPWMLGYWLGNLAMEYRLLKNDGFSETSSELMQTKRDLYYAIEAINRLDYYAEESWGCTPSLNGFLLRGDNSSDFPDYIINGVPVMDLMNEGLVPPPDDFRIKCINSAYTKYLPAGSEASHDHLTGLFIGLALVKALIPANVSWNNNNFSYETVNVSSFVTETRRISQRIINLLKDHNWNYWNTCANRCVIGVHNLHYADFCNNDLSVLLQQDYGICIATCCSDGGSRALPSAIGFAAVNQFIQSGSSGYATATVTFLSLCNTLSYRTAWNTAISLSLDKLAPILAALGNVYKVNKFGRVTSTKNIAKKLRNLVEDGDPDENKGRYWEDLILLHRLIYGTQYDGSNNPITVSNAHYLCLLNAAPCRGYDGPNTDDNIEWGWTDRLKGDRCNTLDCANNSNPRVDYMFYFNLFNGVVPQSAGSYTPIPIKNLARYDIEKPDISALGNLPYKEYDKKNFHAAHNITAHDYEVTYLASEGQGRVTFAAGNKIILGNGFKVTNGGYFHGYIDPTIQAMTCTEPSNTNCEGVFKTAPSVDSEDEDEDDFEDMVLIAQDTTDLLYQENKNEEAFIIEEETPYFKTIISIVPNPSQSGIFEVQGLRYEEQSTNPIAIGYEVRGKSDSYRITVTNVLGETMLHHSITSSPHHQLNLSTHAKGIYFVQIQSGEEFSVHKVVYR